ncbi:MAG: hypothetical protein R3A52_16175 [Polyangiales bacterium]
MNTTDLTRAFDGVLSTLAGSGPQRVRVARAWLLHLVDVPASALPERHREWFLRFGAAMASTERAPLSRDDAEFWSQWLLALALESRRGERSTARATPAHTRPTWRPSAPPRGAALGRASRGSITALRALSPFAAPYLGSA